MKDYHPNTVRASFSPTLHYYIPSTTKLQSSSISLKVLLRARLFNKYPSASYPEPHPANMKSYAAPIALSTIAFLTMLQPCPAPIVTTLAIATAGASIFGSGVGLGAWAASHAIASQPAPVVVAAPSTPQTDRRQDLTPFEQCTYDGLYSAQSIDFPANGSIIVSDLPQSCMSWFEHYNLHPQIDELNEAHGSITKINSTAVELAMLPPYVMTHVEASLLNGTHQETVSRARRSLGAPKAFSA